MHIQQCTVQVMVLLFTQPLQASATELWRFLKASMCTLVACEDDARWEEGVSVPCSQTLHQLQTCKIRIPHIDETICPQADNDVGTVLDSPHSGLHENA